jgi:hypothetical protein
MQGRKMEEGGGGVRDKAPIARVVLNFLYHIVVLLDDIVYLTIFICDKLD